MAGVTMGKHVIALCALAVLWLPGAIPQEQKPPEKAADSGFTVPPDIAKQTNPVKPTPASLAQAKKTFGIDCAMCHGKDGDGKGDLAADMKLNLPDYRDPAALKNKSDGELFYIIQKGKGEMPSDGDRAKPADIWNLVSYIRSLAKKENSAKTPTP